MTKFGSSLIIIILFLIIVIFIQRCNNGKYISPKPDTVTVETIKYIPLKKDTSYIPVPYKVLIPKDSFITKLDTPKTLLEFRDAYFKLLSEKNTKKYYADTLNINDSGLVGYIYSNDTLQKNSITGKGLGYKLTYPRIKETKYITTSTPKKTLWFMGGAVLVDYPFKHIGIEINGGFLNKKSQFYEVGAQSWNNELIYKLGTKIKL